LETGKGTIGKWGEDRKKWVERKVGGAFKRKKNMRLGGVLKKKKKMRPTKKNKPGDNVKR